MTEHKPEVEVELGEERITVKVTLKEAVLKIVIPTALVILLVGELLRRFLP